MEAIQNRTVPASMRKSVRRAEEIIPPARTNLDTGAMTPHITFEPKRARCPVRCCFFVGIECQSKGSRTQEAAAVKGRQK